jgi:2'-5' RNA ligase
MWQELHDDIRALARKGSSKSLRDITVYSKDTWTPHITLCNINGGTKDELKELNEHLNAISHELSAVNDSMFEARGSRIAMGGPIPEQAPLDWDFVLNQV